ncbi:MAG: ATP12 family protein, partial [Cucumibacter sp.]
RPPDDATKPRDDGYGRVQRTLRRELPKRFYKAATVGPAGNGRFAVHLDGSPIRTPGKAKVEVPSEALATRLAAEWAGQGARIDPATMPLTRLVNTAIESGATSMQALRAEIVRFAGSDLLLYRAEAPEELVAKQAEFWDKALDLFAERFGVTFVPAMGIVHHPQPQAMLVRIAAIVAGFGPFSLMALTSATAIAGSAILVLGAALDLFTRDFAWDAAHVDEDFNIVTSGADSEAAARRRYRRADFDAALDVVEMVGLDA